MRRILFLSISLLLLVSCDGYYEESDNPFKFGNVLIDTGDGSKIVKVEVADNAELRSLGLSDRDELPENSGMVFVYFEDANTSFWMKDTKIPLSIAFFDVDGRIHTILDMPPCESDPCPTYAPDKPYRGALEVNLGSFEKWGVEIGDKVTIAH
jgi:uncharacterized protein